MDIAQLSDDELLALAGKSSKAGAFIGGAADSASLGLGDELMAGLTAAGSYALDKAQIDKLIGGDLNKSFEDYYSGALQKNRAQAKADELIHPDWRLAGEITGAIGTGVGGAGTKAGAAIGSWLGSGSGALRAAKASAASAAYGAGYGFGEGEGGIDNRLSAAESNILPSAAIGFVAPTAAKYIGKALSRPTQALLDYASKKMANASGEIVPSKLTKPMQKVYARLLADFDNDPEALKSALYSYQSSPEALIQKGGERTANLAEGAAMYPSGVAKSGEFFSGAIDVAPDVLKQSLSRTVSPTTNYYDTLDNIVESGRKAASPIYKKAFQSNQMVESPIINKILQTPEGQSAMGEAVKNMRNEMAQVAKVDPELTALAKEVEDYVGGGVARGLKLQTLDYVKKAMDSNIRKAIRAGDDGEVARISSLKKSLVSEIDSMDKSGLYAKARAVSGDYLSNKEAMESGLNFLREDPEIIKRMYSGFGKTERASYKSGVVKSIRDTIDRTTDGRNVANLFNNKATRNRLQSILSESEYNKLLGVAEDTDKLFKLRNQITGNSRTTMRQIAAQEFTDMDGINELAQGVIKDGFTRTAIKQFTGYISKQFDGLSDKLAGDVADILYETDPKKKFQIVSALVKEANNSTNAIRGSDAAKKLALFYKASDVIASNQKSLTPITTTKPFENKNNITPVTVAPQVNNLQNLSNEELLKMYDQQSGIESGQSTPTKIDIRPRSGEFETNQMLPQDIMKDEGLRHNSYYDTTGNRTVGYGFNMDSGIARRAWKKAGIKTAFEDVYNGRTHITDDEAKSLGALSYSIAVNDAHDLYSNLSTLSKPRQEALLNLSYQLGKTSLGKFHAFNAAVQQEKWPEAVRHLLKSKYAMQVPNRAREVARKLLRGEA